VEKSRRGVVGDMGSERVGLSELGSFIIQLVITGLVHFDNWT
jgi:hypothetical protein